METSQETKQLLEVYYKGFAEKAGWESVIADDFQYTGGDMTNTSPVIGKDAYIEIIKRFAQRFEGMRPQRVIIENDKAAVIANYDFVFPNGARVNGNVSEFWTVKNGQLSSLTLFFDTLTFMGNLK